MNRVTAEEENVLISKFKKGDESSFNLLVQKYQKPLYFLIRKFVQNHEDADDILQEVLIKAYKSLSSFRGDSAFYTWLSKIAVNCSINLNRRRKLKRIFSIDSILKIGLRDADNPELKIERDEKSRIIKRAVEKLPLKQKSVFILRFYEHKNYKEIGFLLNISESGAKSNFCNALKNLKKLISAEME